MSFRRTDAGLSTMHLFMGVDAVVFVEGGKATYTLEDVAAGSYNSQADDLKYWHIVFSAFAGNRKLHFRAVGSKTTIREIADLILAGRLKRVLVAMDRDLDHLNGSLPVGAGIFSTIGYSWENDVWSSQVVFATFKRFNTSPEVEDPAKQLINDSFATLRFKVKCCARADATLTFNGLDPLPRLKYEKIVRPVRGGAPVVVLKDAKMLIRERRLKIRPARIFGPSTKLLTLSDCYGHMLARFGYHLLVHALSRFCKLKTTPRELLVPAAIDAFAELLRVDPKLTAHFAPMFAAVNWG